MKKISSWRLLLSNGSMSYRTILMKRSQGNFSSHFNHRSHQFNFVLLSSRRPNNTLKYIQHPKQKRSNIFNIPSALKQQKRLLSNPKNTNFRPPKIHVVLIRPQIHWNTGNIGRTTLGFSAHLHLIKPLGFSLDEKSVRRAGLDYWPRVSLNVWENWPEFRSFTRLLEQSQGQATQCNFYAVSKFGRTSLSQVDFRSDFEKLRHSDIHQINAEIKETKKFKENGENGICTFEDYGENRICTFEDYGGNRICTFEDSTGSETGFENSETAGQVQTSTLVRKYAATSNLFLLFGSEIDGLGENRTEIFGAPKVTTLFLPFYEEIRSFNLSTSVGIVLWEAFKQTQEYNVSPYMNENYARVEEQQLVQTPNLSVE